MDDSCAVSDVRLVGGASDYEGRVEICHNRIWVSVCDTHWDNNDANAICNQLGHQSTGSVTVLFIYYEIFTQEGLHYQGVILVMVIIHTIHYTLPVQVVSPMIL